MYCFNPVTLFDLIYLHLVESHSLSGKKRIDHYASQANVRKKQRCVLF